MSMDLYLSATIGALLDDGTRKELVESFSSLYHGGTKATEQVLSSSDSYQAYLDWINTRFVPPTSQELERAQQIQEQVGIKESQSIYYSFEEDPEFTDQDRELYDNYLNYEVVEEHRDKLQKWLQEHKTWKIEWYMM